MIPDSFPPASRASQPPPPAPSGRGDDLACLEDSLRAFRPAPVPPALASRLRAIRGDEAEPLAGIRSESPGGAPASRPRAAWRWPWFAAAAAAAVAGLLLAAETMMGPRRAPGTDAPARSAATSGEPGAPEPARPPTAASPLAFRPLDRARRVLRTHDAGVIVAPGFGPVRPVGFETLEETIFENETGDARLRIETPRDGVLLVPVTLY